MTSTLHHGDCLEVMAGMEPGSVDAVVTDPPYGLGFMGKAWDGLPPGPETASAMLRVLRPSCYLLAFGGTRTWHRLACALEDAGFEIRDTLMWLYGSGFPKGKACLKPAWEPVILARKPGPMRELGIEECRVGDGRVDTRHGGGARSDKVRQLNPDAKGYALPAGRWPANLVLDEEAAAMVDGQSGVSTSTGGRRLLHRFPMDVLAGKAGSEPGDPGLGDSGGASRFYYCAKASRAERNAGCEGMEERAAQEYGLVVATDSRPGESQGARANTPRANHHPTVKPVALMRWLVRLVARPGDTVLDPFTGSGTTGVACAEEGREFIGIEREAEYVEIARRRIEAASAQLTLTDVD